MVEIPSPTAAQESAYLAYSMNNNIEPRLVLFPLVDANSSSAEPRQEPSTDDSSNGKEIEDLKRRLEVIKKRRATHRNQYNRITGGSGSHSQEENATMATTTTNTNTSIGEPSHANNTFDNDDIVHAPIVPRSTRDDDGAAVETTSSESAEERKETHAVHTTSTSTTNRSWHPRRLLCSANKPKDKPVEVLESSTRQYGQDSSFMDRLDQLVCAEPYQHGSASSSDGSSTGRLDQQLANAYKKRSPSSDGDASTTDRLDQLVCRGLSKPKKIDAKYSNLLPNNNDTSSPWIMGPPGEYESVPRGQAYSEVGSDTTDSGEYLRRSCILPRRHSPWYVRPVVSEVLPDAGEHIMDVVTFKTTVESSKE